MIDTANPSNGFSPTDLNNEINKLIVAGSLPAPGQLSSTPIYFAITAPGIKSSDPAAGGYHTTGTRPPLLETKVEGWIGNTGTVDGVTTALSHETVEAATDAYGNGINVKHGNTWYPPPGTEIADNEAQSYTARVGGTLVQSYWSAANQAYIVGGQTRNFFVNNGKLVVDGDQITTNDTITLSVVGTDEVVQQDGETATIPLAEIYSVEVDGGAGNDTINVESTAAGAPVTINLGSGIDTVNVSPTARRLDNIQGYVTVNGGSGTGALILDNQSEPSADPYILSSAAVSHTVGGGIDFYAVGAVTLNGGAGNVTYTVSSTSSSTATTIDSGAGGSTVNVLATSGPLAINGASASDVVNIGGASNVQSILGKVTITNPPSYTTVNVDDSADPTARTATLDTDTSTGYAFGRLVGLAPATIEFKYADTRSVTIQNGYGGGGVVNVRATGVATSIVGHGAGAVNVGNAGSAQGIAGALTIMNPPNYTALSVYDSADTSSRTATLDTDTSTGYAFGRLAGLAPATIEFKYADTLGATIQTGVGGGVVYVRATGVSTSIVGHGATTVAVGNAGSVQGIAGPLLLTNPPNFNSITVDDSADVMARTVMLDTYTPSGDTLYGRITGLAPATIGYRQADTRGPITIDGGSGGNTFNVLGTINTTMILNAGSGTDTVNVRSTTGPLTISTGYANSPSVVNIGSTAPNLGGTLAGILGTVSFANSYGWPLLNVDDSGDTTARAVSITATAITGTWSAPIDTNGITYPTVRGGSGGNTFTVGATNVATNLFSGTGNDMVYYQGSPYGNFVLDGQAGTDNVVLGSTAPVLGGNLTNFGAPVYIGNTAGSTRVILDDTGDTVGRRISVSSTVVSGYGTAFIALWPGVRTSRSMVAAAAMPSPWPGRFRGSPSSRAGAGMTR